MSKAQYDIYVNKVMTLAKTLVVKSQATADAINQSLQEYGQVVALADPTTWKYYLNLAGEYHATDTVMSVISLDTLQTIDFTKANLAQHTATAREYADSASRFYNELVSRYPTQEMLIRGILNPVDMTTAIAAADATILWYDPTLVEDNEENLIPQLQDWIYKFRLRWDVADYARIDDLYAASHLLVMYLNLPPVILNLRLTNCHTRFAHSYHIREFLASHGALDAYVDNLTKKQMLWLYRNIRYLQRNAGKRETFDTLVQNLLTERGLPLAGWGMRHNLSAMPDTLVPAVEFVREPINYGYDSAGVDTRNVAELLAVEEGVAKGNVRVEDEAIPEITTQMQYSLVDRLQTKVLESSVIDMTDASAFTLSDCLLNHWLYLSQTGNYAAVITVDNPHTGGTYTFNVHDAFIVYLYAFNKARGFDMTLIPSIQAQHVRRLTPPTQTELKGIIDSALVGQPLVDAAYLNLAPVKSYISTATFYDAMVKVHQSELDHRFLYATQENYITRGLVEQMVGRFYCDYTCDLAGGQTYASWFQARGLDVPTLSDLEADLLATQLLSVATGANLKVSQSLKDMQGAMLKLMAQLSSYSVQYLQQINSSAIKVVDGPLIRVGEPQVAMRGEFPVEAIDTDVLEIHARGRGGVGLDNAHTVLHFNPIDHARHQISFPYELDIEPYGQVLIRERVELTPMRILNLTEQTSQLSDITVTQVDDYQAP